MKRIFAILFLALSTAFFVNAQTLAGNADLVSLSLPIDRQSIDQQFMEIRILLWDVAAADGIDLNFDALDVIIESREQLSTARTAFKYGRPPMEASKIVDSVLAVRRRIATMHHDNWQTLGRHRRAYLRAIMSMIDDLASQLKLMERK